MTLMVGVIYKQRALPLAWIVYRGPKGHTTARRHIEVLELVQPLLPAEATVILLGDGEYDNVDMIQWLEAHTRGHFVVRTACSSLVHFQGRVFALTYLPITPDKCLVLEKVLFTQAGYGPLLAMVYWELDYEDPTYLLSNLVDAELACRYYRLRYRLETLFSDQKSRGFHLHKSHLSDPNRISRLLIVACLSFIWMIFLGLSIIAAGQQGLIDRTHRRDKSFFRLGLDWLRYLLKVSLSFSVRSDSPFDRAFHETASGSGMGRITGALMIHGLARGCSSNSKAVSERRDGLLCCSSRAILPTAHQ